MTDVEGSAVDALRAKQKKVWVPVLDVQMECESFIARSQRRLTELEKQRVTEEEILFEAEFYGHRQKRSALHLRLRAQVVELQRATQDRELAASKGDQPAKKPRLREDFVPMCVEDAVLC